MDEITVVTVHNPFNPGDREVRKLPYLPGKPVEHYLQESVSPLLPHAELAVSRNGALLLAEDLKKPLVTPGDFIVACPVVGKGGDGGKNIGQILANIALTVFAMYLAAPASFSFWPALGYATATQLGGLIFSPYSPPAVPELATKNIFEPTPAWGRLQPLQGQGHAVPITYGKVRTAGQLVAQHLTVEGDRQYLYLLLCGGEGAVDYPDGFTDDGIDKIQINGMDPEKFGLCQMVKSGDPDDGIACRYGEKLEIDKRYGTNNQRVIANFNDTYFDQYFQVELKSDGSGGDWCAPQTTQGNDGSGLEITIECPAGLYTLKDNGDLAEAWVQIRAQYKRVDRKEWTEWPLAENGLIKGKSYQPVRRVYSLKGLPADKYEVRCQCISKSATDERSGALRVFWTGLAHIVEDDFTRPGKVLVGVKALATDELSGQMPVVTWEQTRSKVLVCTDPKAGGYEWRTATNPAWACYDLIHRAKLLEDPNTGELKVVVKGAPASQIDYEAFQAWAAFCDQKIPERQEDGTIIPVERCTVNIILDRVDDLWRTLAKVEVCGRGKVVLRGTKYSCVFDGESEPVQLFTMGNIVKDSFCEEFLPMQDRAKAIEVTFLNKSKNYQKDVLTVYEQDADLTQLNPTQIVLYGITEFPRAYREACYRLRLNRYLTRTISFEADVDAIACQVGDVILFQHDLPQWGFGGRLVEATADQLTLDRKVLLMPEKSYVVMIRLEDDTLLTARVVSPAQTIETEVLDLITPLERTPQKHDLYAFGELEDGVAKAAKPFRVVKISRSKDFRRRITAVEYDKRVYEENEEIPYIRYTAAVSPVSDLKATQHMDFSGQVWMDLVWKPPREYFGARILINGKQVAQVKAHQTQYSHPVTPGEEYRITVTALDIYGNELGTAKLDYVVEAKTMPPDVQNIVLTEDTYVQKDGTLYTNLTISFEAPSHLPVHYEFYYRIKEDDPWIDGGTGKENKYTISGIPFLGTVQVKVVTVDDRDSSLRSPGVISPLRQLTGKGNPPPAITGFAAVQDEYDRSQIILTWDEPAIPDLKGYKIWLGETWDTAQHNPVCGMVYEPKWVYRIPVDLENPPNGDYTFWIKAVDRTNLESLVPASAKPAGGLVLVTPNTPAQGKVRQDPIDRTIAHVSWDPVDDKDLHEYLIEIWWRGIRDGEPVRVKDENIIHTKETKIQYKMAASGDYEFAVRSRNKAGYYSNPLKLNLPAVTVEPPDVKGFTGKQSEKDAGIIRLTWDELLGVSHFEIRGGLAEDDERKPAWEDKDLIGAGITGYSFETEITEEKPYNFWIKAVSTGGVYSQHAVLFTGIFNLKPARPANFKLTPDLHDKSVLNLSWEAVPAPDVVEYELRSGLDWKTAELIGKTKEIFYRYSPPAGGYIRIMLRAKNRAGYYSDEVVVDNDQQPIILEPANVTGLTALQNGANVLLQWDKVDEPDVTGYEIREGSTFDNGGLVATGVTGTRYQIPVDTETTKRYHVKAINRSGRYSQKAAVAEVTIVDLPPKNVIKEINELSLQSGTHYQTEFGPSLINFSNFGGRFADYDRIRFNEVGGHTVLKLKQYSLISDGHFNHPLDPSLWGTYAAGNLMKNTAGNLYLDSAEENNGITFKLPVLERDTTYVVEVKHRSSMAGRSCGFIGSAGGFAGSGCVPTSIPMANPAGEWQVWCGEFTTGAEGMEPDRFMFCYGVEPCTIEIEWARIYKKADQANYELGIWGEAYYPYGEYLTAPIIMDRMINANISCQFISSMIFRDGVHAKLQYRISRDGDSWSEWFDFIPINTTFKGLQFKVVMSTVDRRKTPEVNEFIILVDVPDVDCYGVAHVEIGGVVIEYGRTFNEVPCVIATATEFGKRAEITGVTKENFQVKVVNTVGEEVGGGINWLARGY